RLVMCAALESFRRLSSRHAVCPPKRPAFAVPFHSHSHAIPHHTIAPHNIALPPSPPHPSRRRTHGIACALLNRWLHLLSVPSLTALLPRTLVLTLCRHRSPHRLPFDLYYLLLRAFRRPLPAS